ncbi:hypothetical protein Tco_0422967 [Tanacetum coccineum]
MDTVCLQGYASFVVQLLPWNILQDGTLILTNAEKLKEVSISSSNEVRGVEGRSGFCYQEYLVKTAASDDSVTFFSIT